MTVDIEKFIEHYIKNIRALQQLTDAQIEEVMMIKIQENSEYLEIIADVSQKVDNKKLINQVLAGQAQAVTEMDAFTGRKIA